MGSLGNMLQRSLARVGLALGFVLLILQCALILRSPLSFRSIVDHRWADQNSSAAGAASSVDADAWVGSPAPPPPALSWTADDERALSFPQLVNKLYDYIERPSAHCARKIKIGGQVGYKHLFDGHKWACLDERYGLTTSRRCLVYSFGISSDWSFDDSVQQLRCHIYAFDPTIGRPDHNRSSRIHFYNLGLSDASGRGRVGRRPAELRRYADIVAMLGHQRSTVHYLKVDVEGSEWPFLADVLQHSRQLLQNVMQIGMEIHFDADDWLRKSAWWRYLRAFAGLEEVGFRLFHSEVNPYEAPRQLFAFTNRPVSRVYELVWLNQGGSSR